VWLRNHIEKEEREKGHRDARFSLCLWHLTNRFWLPPYGIPKRRSPLTRPTVSFSLDSLGFFLVGIPR
jgi:hypothetical protein